MYRAVQWCSKEHYRFPFVDRAHVRFLLWIGKQLPIDKNVWLQHVIPHLVPPLVVSDLYVTGLRADTTLQEVLQVLNVPVECITLSGSLGYGFFRPLRYDDLALFLSGEKTFYGVRPGNPFVIGGEGLLFAECKEDSKRYTKKWP
jgi:hypothetical protein